MLKSPIQFVILRNEGSSTVCIVTLHDEEDPSFLRMTIEEKNHPSAT